MKNIETIILVGWLLLAPSVFAHGPEPGPLQDVPIPPVPGLMDGPDPIIIDKTMAIALGKALWWDMNVGSDGMVCAGCHGRAGAGQRLKNQMNPGLHSLKPSGKTFEAMASGPGTGGPNYTVNTRDFPFYQYNDPLNKASGVKFSTNDVLSSAGTFSGDFIGASKFTGMNDECVRSPDPVFNVHGVGTRQAERRNAPSLINAVFNYRTEWNGVGNNIFNGSSEIGERDPNAGVWVKINARTVQKQRLHLPNSTIAAVAVGAAELDTFEIPCRQRTMADIGRKLLLRQPLQYQKVHNEDSVLGPFSLSSPGNLKPGLNTTYKNMITQTFNPKYWSYSGTGPFPPPPPGQEPYNQMEANFPLFFGLSIQAYVSTLVSDQAPIDLTERDPVTYRPKWTGPGLSYTPEQIASLKNGFDQFLSNHCNLCHSGPVMTLAAIVPNATLVTPTTPPKYFGPAYNRRAFGPNAMGPNNGAAAAGITRYGNLVTRDQTLTADYKLMDVGFANTGVADPEDDPGLAQTDDFGNPLSFSAQYVEYLLGNTPGIIDPGVNKVRSCDFLYPLAFNIPDHDDTLFTAADGIIPDVNVSNPATCRTVSEFAGKDAFIPTKAAAAANLANMKMAVATKGAFKIPSLRNVELTGPYMHNGSMATLEQVIEFYARKGNVDNDDMNILIDSITLAGEAGAEGQAIAAKNRADVVAFLKTLTDDRVRYQKAPFDHPELVVQMGQKGDNKAVVPGNPLQSNLGQDETLTTPAIGKNGSTTPILPFHQSLAP